MTERTSFVIYTQHLAKVEKLTDEDAGQLLKALYRFTQGERVTSLSPATDMLYEIITDQVEENWKKWDESKQKRADAGKKGGEAKASNAKQRVAEESNAKQSQAKLSRAKHNVNVSVNGNVTGNVDVNKSPNERIVFPHGRHMNVMLTTEEFDEVLKKLGKKDADYYINRVSDYMHETGKLYPEDQHARKILQFAEGDMQRAEQKIIALNTAPIERKDLYARARKQLEGKSG